MGIGLGTGVLLFGEGKKLLRWQIGEVIYAGVDLPGNSLIVDIGGGQDPHPGANVIVDKFIDDNTHRCSQHGLMRNAQTLFVNSEGVREEYVRNYDVAQADIVDLPFPDKSIDFAITRHILEHIPDLPKALSEISRVAKAGYIEVPSMASEMLFPQGDIHCWAFTVEKGRWIARSIIGFKSPFGKMMHALFAERDDIREAWQKAYHHFHICFLWKGSVDCEIGEEK